jgi:acetyl-CoA carboxylase carboxyltransferase component
MAENIEFNKNEDKMMQLVGTLNRKLDKIYEGGGKSRIEKEREKGKMSARERIYYLLDKDSPRIEIGALAADDMYKEHGGCPSAGVVVVIGYIKKKQCIVVANDATVKAGAWFPMTGKKNLRAQEIAMENRLPIKPAANHLSR